MHNAEIAAALEDIAELLELEGANRFRIRAYRNAVRSIETSTKRLSDLAEAGIPLTSLPGIGKELERHILEILETGSSQMLRDLWEEEMLPGAAAASDADLFEFARSKGGTVFHPVGTCRMGSDAEAVVDPQLRVQGVSGLRVIDASVMPTLVSANSNAAAIMIGERGADLILNPPSS